MGVQPDLFVSGFADKGVTGRKVGRWVCPPKGAIYTLNAPISLDLSRISLLDNHSRARDAYGNVIATPTGKQPWIPQRIP